jgi:hypothetical protein
MQSGPENAGIEYQGARLSTALGNIGMICLLLFLAILLVFQPALKQLLFIYVLAQS